MSWRRRARRELPLTTRFTRSGRGWADRCASEIVNGAVLERGPDSFLTEKPAAAELCRELGLGGELLPSNDAARKTYIVVRNRLVALPDGLMFLVPTKLVPTALTRLFGLRTKIRMGLELLHPPRPSGGDESVAALVRRHFGQEAVDRLADPLLSGIYGGDAEQLSAQTVLPRHGGDGNEARLADARDAGGAQADARRDEKGRNRKAGGTKREAPAIFTALRGGMSQLVDALVARIDPANVRIGTPVSAIRKTAGGWTVDAGGARQEFDGLIMAAPAWAAATLLKPVDAVLGSELAGFRIHRRSR